MQSGKNPDDENRQRFAHQANVKNSESKSLKRMKQPLPCVAASCIEFTANHIDTDYHLYFTTYILKSTDYAATFIIMYILIWVSMYFSIKAKIKKMNKQLQEIQQEGVKKQS